MNQHIDTIAAISTPLGTGGIGVIRISGNLVPVIAPKLLGKIPNPRKAEYLPFLDKNGYILEHVIALFFPEPHSFTGENILEIHGHGGQMILDLLLDSILETSSNIRLANPGEFTERAFLNGKIDLIQAEAIADIINANSYQAAKSASNSLQGMFSNQIHIILEKIINLRMYIESSINFPDEEINELSYNEISDLLDNIIHNIKEINQSTRCGILLREGIKIVIAGKPNSGKSSIFNKLIGTDRAIVSKISGTTRDTLYENIQLNGVACYITDTAGLQNSDNEIELIGITKTKHELKKADHILWVIDSNDPLNQNPDEISHSLKKISYNINKKTPITIIRNKSDLSLETPGINLMHKYTCITLSALLNDGLDYLRSYLYDYITSQTQHKKTSTFHCNENQGNFIARKRHLNTFKKVYKYLLSAKKHLLDSNYINEYFAEDLRSAHDELNKIFGKSTPDDLLKKIFSTFCIGK